MFFLLDKLEPNKSNVEYLRTLQNSLNGKEGGKSTITLVDSKNSNIMIGTKKTYDFDQTSNIKNDEIFIDSNQIEDVINNRQSKCVKLDDGNEWYVEIYTTPSTLLICGGGHIANSLAPLAHKLNFNVWITDDRKEFANSNRFPKL